MLKLFAVLTVAIIVASGMAWTIRRMVDARWISEAWFHLIMAIIAALVVSLGMMGAWWLVEGA